MKMLLSLRNKAGQTGSFLLFLLIVPVFLWAQSDSPVGRAESDWSTGEKTASSLLTALDFCSSGAYKKLLKLTKTDAGYEKNKIEYLLDRISRTPYNFVRNGQEYDGRVAAAHLRMKWFHAVKQVKTAADFADKIGSRSSMSGRPYYVNINGNNLLLRDLLLNELKNLEQELVQSRAHCSD